MSRSFLCLCVFACILEHDANQPFALSESGRRAHHRRCKVTPPKRVARILFLSASVARESAPEQARSA